MITIEHDEPNDSVALFFDAEGGKVLVDLIQGMIENDVNDHFHLTDYVAPQGNNWPEIKKRSLSLETPDGRSGDNILTMLTVLYRKNSWDNRKS